jgi:twitching motility protein PilJ
VRALAAGDSDLGVNALGGGLQDELSSISTLMERAERAG